MTQFVNSGVIPVKIMLESVQWIDRLGGLDEAITLFRDPATLDRMGAKRIYFPNERQRRWSAGIGYDAFCCLSRSTDGRWYLEYTADIPLDALICLK